MVCLQVAPVEFADAIALARRHAETGELSKFFGLCIEIADAFPTDLSAQLEVGSLLSSYGFLSSAQACYEKAHAIASDDMRATVNLANLLRDSGSHKASRDLYADLLCHLFNHPVIRRNRALPA